MYAVYAVYNICPIGIESAAITDAVEPDAFAAFAALKGFTDVQDCRHVGGNISYHRPADGRFIVKVGESSKIRECDFAAACLVNSSYSF